MPRRESAGWVDLGGICLLGLAWDSWFQDDNTPAVAASSGGTWKRALFAWGSAVFGGVYFCPEGEEFWLAALGGALMS